MICDFFIFLSGGGCTKIAICSQDLMLACWLPGIDLTTKYWQGELIRLFSLLCAVIALADHPVCGQNFTYDACDTTCGAASCREHLSDIKSECRACVSGCRCKDNYVRLGDKCVLRSDCKS